MEGQRQDAGLGRHPSPRMTVSPAVDAPDTREWTARVRQAARAARWFARGVVGADAYDRYLDFHARSGCAQPAMSEREFWRDKTDRQERNPTSRCC